MYVCIYSRVYACKYVCMYACMRVCVYVCMYVCMRACYLFLFIENVFIANTLTTILQIHCVRIATQLRSSAALTPKEEARILTTIQRVRAEIFVFLWVYGKEKFSVLLVRLVVYSIQANLFFFRR